MCLHIHDSIKCEFCEEDKYRVDLDLSDLVS